MKKMKSLLSLLLCLSLLAAAGLSVLATAEEAEVGAPVEFVVPATETSDEIVISLSGTQEEPVELGEGATQFIFQVIDLYGYESWFRINTDEKLLSDALLKLGLIDGSDSEYGLYVDTVCGTQLIYTDENPVYWSFLINGEYADHGVSSEEINPENVYCMKAEAWAA